MGFSKREDDIEMSGMIQEPKKTKDEEVGDLQDTDYKPVDWKRLLLSPKYIRTIPTKPEQFGRIVVNVESSMAHPLHYPRNHNRPHHNLPR